MDIIFSASIIAAFLAGVVALFAPCCITVLLPAYLASAFREKKAMLRMTLIFFAGIAAVLIPIGLGAASLALVFREWHSEMYIIGGLLMIVFGYMSVTGRSFSMIPGLNKFKTGLNAGHPKSVFMLGVFSGAATSCCAPVLAGAVTLAVISSAFWKALIVMFAYVFGMVFPLFITAYFYDRWQIDQSRLIQGKILNLNLGFTHLKVHSTNLLAGLIFVLMGLILVTIALSTSGAYWAPHYQVAIGEELNNWSLSLTKKLMQVPDYIWGVLIISLFVFFIYNSYRQSKNVKSSKDSNSEPESDHQCH